MEVFLITVQRFFKDKNGVHRQLTEDKPVSSVHQTREGARDMLKDFIEFWQWDADGSYQVTHTAEENTSTEQYIINEGKTPVCVYTLREEYVMP